MLKLIRVFKYSIFALLIGRFFGQIRASNPVKSGTTSEDPQQSSESQPAEQQDPYKTTFEGNLVNLDINCLHGYSKFSCTISYTEVTYQSSNLFKSALDGDTEIWKSQGTNAFRLKSQFLDLKPLSLMVEFDRGDDSTALYFRKKFGLTEWEGIDKNTHSQFVDDFKKKLKEHKDSLENDSKDTVDLHLKIKSTTEIEFNFHSYKSNAEKVSEGTDAAKNAGNKITNQQYTVKNTEEKDGTGVVKKEMEVELTDKKYRIVKIEVKSKVSSCCKVWETGGKAFCRKVVATWEIDSLKELVLTLTYKDSGKNTELVLKANPSWKYLYNFEEITEKDLPTFNFEY
ncbi:hypothetical protein MACJ_001053 [Theileria orientalis]|uniref:Signal peptide containing protein n=1 Tax=Theileria orientalis TaxID=68886 RepID=A0A976QTF1_THEOR|nr:hypothetical protein MACJ_001053 [Theileria orientalis]